MRSKIEDTSQLSLVVKGEKDFGQGAGVAQALGAFNSARLSWKDLPWLRQHTDLPILLKGIQTGEDAVLAAQHGVEGIIVSNHGGRQLDQVRPTLDVLVEVIQDLREAGLAVKVEVFLDGGIRRGTDVYKALALGARAVGIGRPAMYALSFGQEGVEKALTLLRDEFRITMQLMGKNTVAEITAKDVVFKPGGAMLSSDGWPLPSRL